MNDAERESFRRVIHSPDGLRAIALYIAAGALRVSAKGGIRLAEFLDDLRPPNGGDSVRSFDAGRVRRAEEFEAEAKALLERSAGGGDNP